MKLMTGQALKSKAAPAKVIPILSGKIWKINENNAKEIKRVSRVKRHL
jgi:hypothetical protein